MGHRSLCISFPCLENSLDIRLCSLIHFGCVHRFNWFLFSFVFSYSSTPILHMLVHQMISCISLRFGSFFFILLPLPIAHPTLIYAWLLDSSTNSYLVVIILPNVSFWFMYFSTPEVPFDSFLYLLFTKISLYVLLI